MSQVRRTMRQLGAVVVLMAAAGGNTPVVAAPEVKVDRVDHQQVGLDRPGKKKGEASAIVARAAEYRRRHAVNGQLSWREMAARTRWAEQRWREEQRSGAGKDGGGATWISLGPTNSAGRASSVAAHPFDANVVLVGAASGGVWKTVDGGDSWYPTTDHLSDLAVGAVAFAPSNPAIAYVGTGEGDTYEIPGIGLLRSDDGGESWFLPAATGDVMAEYFFQLSVHPNDPDRLVAATDRGIVTSDDGGVTWDMRLASGGSFVATTNVVRTVGQANRLYASNWCSPSCPGGIERVMTSLDGGVTWTGTGNIGLAVNGSFAYSRVALAVAPSNANLLYAGANISTSTNGDMDCAIYKSSDGGATWTATANPGPYLTPQGWYDNIITVSPVDSSVVLAGGISYVRTTNGGQSWLRLNPYNMQGQGLGAETVPHVDAHAYSWSGSTLWLGNDGGVWRTTDGGATWKRRNTDLVTRQNYGIAISSMNRERIVAGAQDNGTFRRNDVGDDTWSFEVGGDGGECAINPLVPDIYVATVQFTSVYRKGPPSNNWRPVSPELEAGEDPPFVTPITQHPTWPNVLFTGGERVYRSDDTGATWYPLGTTVSNGFWSTGSVWSIAATPADPERLAAAKGSTIVYTSHDGGRTWLMGMVSRMALDVAISPHVADSMLAAMAASTVADGGVIRSDNGGLTWSASGAGLPPFNVQTVAFDPLDDAVAYAGTDVGLYRSVDGGRSWRAYGEGLPAVSIHDLAIAADGALLRVGTYGRGTWELVADGPGNDQPTITITAPTAEVVMTQGGAPLDLRAVAADADGEALSVAWRNTRDWEAVPGGDGIGSLVSAFMTNVPYGGTYQVAAVATDARGATAVDYLTVRATDPADSCVSPTQIPGDGPFPVTVLSSNSEGTVEASDPTVSCADPVQNGADAGRVGSTWFALTPTESATYALSTCGSSADTVLSVWTGEACGPYLAVACSDDDEQAHCPGPRTDSYLELELAAGTTYRVMVGAWRASARGDFAVTVDCLTCGILPPDERRLYLVPAASHAPGAEGTTWLTDLELYNPGTAAVAAELAFLPPDSDNSAATGVAVTLTAGSSVSLPDVVATTLAATGSGAVKILADGELVIASRTYNNAAAGTFGQFIPGVAVDAAVAPGAAVRLVGLAENAAFRTNLGLANTSAEVATVTIDLIDAAGVVRAQDDKSLKPYGWLQVYSIFAKEGLSDVTAASAVVRNTSTGAGIMTYASVVDAGTGDPTFVATAPAATAGMPVWIAAAAHAGGVGSSVWRTDLVLANVGEVDLVATVELLVHGQANPAPASFTQAMAAGTSLQIGDVIAAGFAHTGAGALRVSVDGGQLVVTSRTYTLSDDGTYGQFIAGVGEGSAIGAGERAALIQLRQVAGEFRTNVGVVNLTGNPLEVQADYYDNLSGYLGSEPYRLEPWEYRQDNAAVPGAGSAGAYAILTSASAGAAYLAYASVIDSGSDDPVFIPATVLAAAE